MVAFNKTLLIGLASAVLAYQSQVHRAHTIPNQLATAHGSNMMQAAWDSPIMSDARSHMENGAQRVQEVVNSFKNDPSRAGQTAGAALITGLDGQIDASLGTIFNVAHYATMGLSDPVANFILGPFFQSVTDGIEVLLGNAMGSVVDVALTPLTGGLVKNVNRLIKEGQAYHMNVSKLKNMASQLTNSLPKRDFDDDDDDDDDDISYDNDLSSAVNIFSSPGSNTGYSYGSYDSNNQPTYNIMPSSENGLVARGYEDSYLERRGGQPPWHVWEDARAHLTNGAQRVKEVANSISKDPSRAGATTVTALIAGLDGQIDASLGTIFSIAHTATLGLSDPLAGFILGPFFQSVTDGLEVVVGNLVGGVADVALTPVTGGLIKNVNRLINEGQKYHMNTAKMANLNQQLQNRLPKGR